jgi:hypothetical protein
MESCSNLARNPEANTVFDWFAADDRASFHRVAHPATRSRQRVNTGITNMIKRKRKIKNMRITTTKTGNASNRARLIAGFAFAVLITHNAALGAQLPVNLGTAGSYVILAKSGISTVPPSAVTGDLGVSPIDSTALTGFSLILDGSGQFSTSSQVTGKLYAPDYASPTPANLTTAVSDMETAYTDAAGRTLPDATELGSGNIGGMTLAPGLYKWSTDLTIPTDVTFSGGPNDVWIFQIAGNISIAGAKSVILSGGAQARNIFWQVAGGVGVALGTTSHFEGIILTQAGITLQTGASINGRLLAQTAVTLDANTVTVPPSPPSFGPVARASDGTVTLVITNTPDRVLTVQYSTDLISWTTLFTPTPTISPYVTSDTSASADAMRFYRALYP